MQIEDLIDGWLNNNRDFSHFVWVNSGYKLLYPKICQIDGEDTDQLLRREMEVMRCVIAIYDSFDYYAYDMIMAQRQRDGLPALTSSEMAWVLEKPRTVIEKYNIKFCDPSLKQQYFEKALRNGGLRMSREGCLSLDRLYPSAEGNLTPKFPDNAVD